MDFRIIRCSNGDLNIIIERLRPLQGLVDLFRLRESMENGTSFIGFRGDDLIAGGGITKVWERVGEGWMFVTPIARQCPLFFHKKVKTLMYDIIRENGYERVQTVVKSDFYAGRRWVEMLGFRPEGVMRKYINGEDYIRYSLIL